MELLEEFPSSDDQVIVRGKRTRRPRLSSSASSYGDFGYFCNSVSPTPTTSSGISTSTEEDEDMANCLILLACGSSPPLVEAENKFTTRKFAEMATTTDGKVGIYVYECKTCNRTFPSFQALGGHRAGHKRPKPAADDVDRKRSPPATPQQDRVKEAAVCTKVKSTISSPLASTQLANKSFPIGENKIKIHECSVCGSEFASGQALGGHMRRHRSVPVTNNNGIRSGTVIENDTSSHDVIIEKARNMLELDLNLPAPEDDHRPENFHQFSANQPRLVFSAPPLVDCHY